MRDDMNGAVLGLKLTLNDQEPRGEDGLALCVLYALPDNEARDTKLVLQRHEHHAGGGFGALAMSHDTCDEHLVAASERHKFIGLRDVQSP